MEVEEECPVCMETPPNVMFSPCRHSCCFLCAMKLKECPLCRAPIKSRMSRKMEDHEHIVSLFPTFFTENKALYKSISVVLGDKDTKKTAVLIFELARELHGWISVQQTNNLLIKARDKGVLDWRIRNSLVRLCNEPWRVDYDLAREGLCYYGNGGEIPFLEHGISLLWANVRNTFGLY
jgi:hypothetical protein